MITNKKQVELLVHLANALDYIAEAITKDDQNSNERHSLAYKAKGHITKFHSQAERILQPNKKVKK